MFLHRPGDTSLLSLWGDENCDCSSDDFDILFGDGPSFHNNSYGFGSDCPPNLNGVSMKPLVPFNSMYSGEELEGIWNLVFKDKCFIATGNIEAVQVFHNGNSVFLKGSSSPPAKPTDSPTSPTPLPTISPSKLPTEAYVPNVTAACEAYLQPDSIVNGITCSKVLCNELPTDSSTIDVEGFTCFVFEIIEPSVLIEYLTLQLRVGVEYSGSSIGDLGIFLHRPGQAAVPLWATENRTCDCGSKDFDMAISSFCLPKLRKFVSFFFQLTIFKKQNHFF